MPPRKPLDPNCTGGIFCPVPGHTGGRMRSSGSWRYGHIPLTRGQLKTLDERLDAQAAAVFAKTKEQES